MRPSIVSPSRLSAALLASGLFVSSLAAEDRPADPPAPPVDESTPAAPMTETTPSDPLQKIVQEMKSAGDRLERGLLDEETRQAQRKIVDDLEKLLRQSRQKNQNKSPSDSPSNPDSSPNDQDQNSKGDSSDMPESGGAPGQRRRNDQENAAESQERTEGGIPTDPDRKNQRRVLTDAVWGHLPPRVREQLNRSFNDRYLPEYDAMVKRYYEALATRRRDADAPSRETSPRRDEASPP